MNFFRNIDPYKRKEIQLYFIFFVTIFTFDFFFCNSKFVTNLLLNKDFSIKYVFSIARIFLYFIFFMILKLSSKKIINNRISFEKNKNNKEKRLPKIIIIFFIVVILSFTLHLIISSRIMVISLSVICLLLLYFAFIYLFYSNNYRLNILICSTICFIFAITTITIHPIDEIVHYTTSYNIAQGNFGNKISYSNEGMDSVRTWGNFNSTPDLQVKYNKKNYTYKKYNEKWPVGGNEFPYYTSALGIFIAQHLGGTIMDTFYFGRLFNALLFMFMLAFLLKIIKKNIYAFSAVITTPFFLLLAGTYNVDIFGAMSIFLFSIYIFNIAFDKTKKNVNLKDFIVLIVLSFCIISFKSSAYFFIFLLLLLLYKKIPKKYQKILGAIYLVLLVYLIYRSVLPKELVAGSGDKTGMVDMNKQLHFLLKTPTNFFNVYFLHTLNTWLNPIFYTHLNTSTFFGHYSTYLVLPYIFYLIHMGFSNDDNDLKISKKVFIILVSLLLFYFTSTTMYLGYTPVGQIELVGYQSRYIFPFLPLILMNISNSRIRINKQNREVFNFSLTLIILFSYSSIALLTLMYE